MSEPNEREMELAREWGAAYFANPLSLQSVSNMLAAYRRELALKWTRDVPTVPGMYHVRTLISVCHGSMSVMSESEWAGPLPEPEEP